MTQAPDTIDTETIYVFDPPGGAWFSTPMVPGDLCRALGQRRDETVDIEVVRSSVYPDTVGCYLGVVSPECLRPATPEESTGVVLPARPTAEEIEATDRAVTGTWKVVRDEHGDPKLSRVEAEDREGWTDTGFRGSYFECCRHVDRLYGDG